VKKDIPLEEAGLNIERGADVTDIQVIAEGNEIRDVDDLVNTYKKPNGSLTSPKDWLKVKGRVTVKKMESRERSRFIGISAKILVRLNSKKR
jgi:hypothetical protein